VIPYEKNVVAARKSRGVREFDLPGTHFDGRPINRERPFLVGLGRVIRRPTNDFKLDREPNVDPMFSAKPHGRPFFQCCRAPELRTQAVCDASQDISPFLAPPLEHPPALVGATISL